MQFCSQILFYFKTSSEHTTKELASVFLDRFSSIPVVDVVPDCDTSNIFFNWVNIVSVCVNLSFHVENDIFQNARENVAISTTTLWPGSVQKTFAFMAFCHKRNFYLQMYL